MKTKVKNNQIKYIKTSYNFSVNVKNNQNYIISKKIKNRWYKILNNMINKNSITYKDWWIIKYNKYNYNWYSNIFFLIIYLWFSSILLFILILQFKNLINIDHNFIINMFIIYLILQTPLSIFYNFFKLRNLKTKYLIFWDYKNMYYYKNES